MTEPEKKRDAVADPPGEQRPEEARSDHPDADPSTPGEKAWKIPADEIAGRATDTIDDGDGSYLEPPD